MSYHDEPEQARWFNERLFKTRTILLCGYVDFELAGLVNQSLLMLAAASDEPIDLVINSGGGSVTGGYSIYDTVRFVKPRVRCIAAGMTGSIAAVLYCAAEKEDRFSLPNTRFLLHQPLTGATGQASDLELEAKEILRIRAGIHKLLSSATGRALEDVAKDTSRDLWMDAPAALDYGLVGTIIASRSEL